MFCEKNVEYYYHSEWSCDMHLDLARNKEREINSWLTQFLYGVIELHSASNHLAQWILH